MFISGSPSKRGSNGSDGSQSSLSCLKPLEKSPVVNSEQPCPKGSSTRRVSRLARRIHGWSWQAFPIGMGTGAVYVTLSGLKEHPGALTTVEAFFFFLNLSIFLINSTTLLLQAILYPRQSRRLICDPVKGVYVPFIVLSFSTIVIGSINYGVIPGHLSPEVIYVFFWIYVFLSVSVCFPMLMIWYNKPHDGGTFTPAWVLLIFPMMFVGVIAANVLRVLDPSDSRAVGVLFVGYFFQSVGFFMTTFYICIYILRYTSHFTGLMEDHQANGVFDACGPPGFTALTLLLLGSYSREILSQHDLVTPLAGEIWYSSSVLVGLLLFGLSIFFFVFGILPYLSTVRMDLSEILGCWALTFPNVGWISCLRVLGDDLGIHFFFVLHAIMVVVVCVLWVVLVVLTALAFWRGKILLATEADVLRDEDRVPLAKNGSV
ncbi:voltage-dependent anion channel-domain-containing protein [Russula earlei]|uniref:Voltage-dependent anion channel-domain-containing protein n=1 Tax=Russula earlei TaxID=71964 RepID=A0ACC0U4F5_9AGAM|nr:voltage-dependent anion channel-domain-containing protein [Russula earlei]